MESLLSDAEQEDLIERAMGEAMADAQRMMGVVSIEELTRVLNEEIAKRQEAVAELVEEHGEDPDDETVRRRMRDVAAGIVTLREVRDRFEAATTQSR